MIRRLAPALAALLLAGCGVDSEDVPQPIEDTSHGPESTPSVDTRPGPSPRTAVSAPPSAPSPTNPSSSNPPTFPAPARR